MNQSTGDYDLLLVVLSFRRLLRCKVRRHHVCRDEVESFDIVADAYAEFEEVEDEGACYAFDLADGGIVFLTGQQFYPSARFPSLDFSVAYPLDENGASADMWIEKRGPASEPDRVVSAAVKRELAERIPEPLEVVPRAAARSRRLTAVADGSGRVVRKSRPPRLPGPWRPCRHPRHRPTGVRHSGRRRYRGRPRRRR